MVRSRAGVAGPVAVVHEPEDAILSSMTPPSSVSKLP